MMKKFTVVPVLCLLFLGLTGCEKDTDQPTAADLTGNWDEPNLNFGSRRLSFTKNKDFSYLIKMNGAAEFSSLAKGSYAVKGDNLNFTVTEDSGAGTGNMLPGNYELFEKATFSIKKDTLIIRYISYPADAPSSSTSKFVRVK